MRSLRAASGHSSSSTAALCSRAVRTTPPLGVKGAGSARGQDWPEVIPLQREVRLQLLPRVQFLLYWMQPFWASRLLRLQLPMGCLWCFQTNRRKLKAEMRESLIQVGYDTTKLRTSANTPPKKGKHNPPTAFLINETYQEHIQLMPRVLGGPK